jgi:hypothetical protein
MPTHNDLIIAISHSRLKYESISIIAEIILTEQRNLKYTAQTAKLIIT